MNSMNGRVLYLEVYLKIFPKYLQNEKPDY